MSILDALEATFTNMSIISSITSTVFIILLGFYLRKRGVFGEDFGKTLSKVVLSVALPALAFKSFMQPIDGKTLSQGMSVLIWGILIYIILIIITPFSYMKYPKDKKEVLAILTTFGSTTFFGIPIVGAVYGAKGIMYSSIFNIGYRIFLYSYAYIRMSGLKMEVSNIKKMFLNPIVIATFAGLILWMVQDFAPMVTVKEAINGVVAPDAATIQVAFYRIDQTAIWLFKPLSYLGALASPLAWLSIGATLGSISFKKAASDKTSWYYSFNKVILVPLINLVLLAILTATNILPVDHIALATVVIMMATPTATVAASYAISFDRDALLASNASLISTVVAVIATPIWIALLEILNQVGLFK
ncbi:malate permease [Companilactobacillus sp. RD055328]|uniref:AEC family transporter n=1 Tax=Companilactobacillus sp. RD055328 TaxID=2916634 RepID=UPI001FC7C60B|nr:AEC family transporter [Companilactobacillus sp. RD055328]GKQ42418.1 malate permease [Companilactobacillus sp. RD055328]